MLYVPRVSIWFSLFLSLVVCVCVCAGVCAHERVVAAYYDLFRYVVRVVYIVMHVRVLYSPNERPIIMNVTDDTRVCLCVYVYWRH